MARYALIAVEGPRQANPGKRVAELEQATIESIEWRLNDSGAMTFSIPTIDDKADWTQLVKYEFQVWRNDVLLWWGVPFTRRINVDRLTCACKGLWEYLKYRFIHHAKTYTDSDQFTIAWDLISYAQTAFEGADLNIDSSGFLGSGVLRDRTYPADEHGNIATLVYNLTQVINGFDFEVEIFGDGRREWTPYYPSKGTQRDDLVLELTERGARGIVDFDEGEDASRMANWVTSTGAGMGPDKLEQSYVDEAARDSYVLMQDVISDTNVTELINLYDKARGSVEARKNPIKLPSVKVEDTADIPTIGVIKTGDVLPVRISYGAVDVNGLYRAMRIKLDPRTELQDIEFELVEDFTTDILFGEDLFGMGAFQ